MTSSLDATQAFLERLAVSVADALRPEVTASRRVSYGAAGAGVVALMVVPPDGPPGRTIIEATGLVCADPRNAVEKLLEGLARSAEQSAADDNGRAEALEAEARALRSRAVVARAWAAVATSTIQHLDARGPT